MKNTKISFIFYEPVDQWVIHPIVRHLKSAGIRVTVINGFSYDRHIQQVKYPRFVRKPTAAYFCFQKPGNRVEKLFSFLLREKAKSMETRILLNQVDEGEKLLRRRFSKQKPDLIVVPETIRAAHGQLVLEIARKFQIKTCVVPPPYYEWITTRPLLGQAAAHQWIVSSKAYVQRLKDSGVRGKIHSILPSGKYLKQYATLSERRRKQPLSEPRKNFFIATLQNNQQQDLFLSLLAESFARLPGENLWIKFHPTTSLAVKKKIRAQFQSNNIFFSEAPLLQHLSKARAIITTSSTSALLAIEKKVPVMIAHLDFFYHELNYLLRFYRCFLTVSDPDELTNNILRLSLDSFRQHLVRKQAGIRKDFFSKKKLLLQNLNPARKK